MQEIFVFYINSDFNNTDFNVNYKCFMYIIYIFFRLIYILQPKNCKCIAIRWINTIYVPNDVNPVNFVLKRKEKEWLNIYLLMETSLWKLDRKDRSGLI